MKKIIVTGAYGQLGRSLQEAAVYFPDFLISAYDIDRLDITDPAAVFDMLQAAKAQVLINCAAYTAVDRAETNAEAARALNATAVKHLTEICRQLNMLFIHISTDYVFDGNAEMPYKEGDIASPMSVYGASKFAGEQFALAYEYSIVIRTSWLYAPQGTNFVAAMLRLGAERDQIKVVNDQIGSPTYAPHLAEAILQMISQINDTDDPRTGLYHFCNRGTCSWYEFAQKIRMHAGFKAEILPIASAEYPTPVKRPAFSALCTDKISKAFSLTIPTWEKGLEEYFNESTN